MSETREALYERYRDALRRGHVAALRGRPDAALVAYDEAARIAPERSVPHASVGAVLARLGRNDEALLAYDRALERAPTDETTLRGRADVLVGLGRRVEAAETLATLAEALDAAGRTAEACDAARRALELAESRPRRRYVTALVARLRGSGEDAAIEALDRALRILEPESSPRVSGGEAAAPSRVVTDPATVGTLAEDGPPPAPPNGIALGEDADDRLDAGDPDGARAGYLAAAAAHRAVGRTDAALDACYVALRLAPAEPDLHLALVELYLDRGWRTQAADKLVLLGRLVALADDPVLAARVASIGRARFPDDPRFTAPAA